ncbi:heme/hemin ABC transporter substrate-binding protein [Thalassolituus sp. LLYu03]|uniref:heme/hemin ABC transporter substrate-binding protein n=1 Tax=Thalassolituus sp. LLYu03 TaxID=3421656 RepID=UPI003D2E5C1A
MSGLLRISARALGLLLVCAACGATASQPASDSGANNTGTSKTGSIVSVDGALTEIVYALGAEQRLLGVDTTSLYPAAAQQLPQVGYMRALSAEGILSLRPATVLASRDAGPAVVFDQLSAAGVQVVRISTDDSAAGVADKIRQVAQALDIPVQGEALATQVLADTQRVLDAIPDGESPRTLFLMGAGGRGLMAAGSATRAQALLSMTGAHNVLAHQGYKPVNAESALQAAPEVVLVGQTGAMATDSLQPLLAMTPAAQNARVHGLDAGLILGFGPRLPEALSAVLPLLYPQVAGRWAPAALATVPD